MIDQRDQLVKMQIEEIETARRQRAWRDANAKRIVFWLKFTILAPLTIIAITLGVGLVVSRW